MSEEKIFEALGSLRTDLINLKLEPKNPSITSSIQNDLNEIFPGIECKEVIYTDNTDKMMFGALVMPVFSSMQQVNEIVISDDKFAIKAYKVELDSKLFDAYIGLTIDEVLALLVHNVAELVMNDTPCRKVRYLIDKYLFTKDEELKLCDYLSYIEILSFGVKSAAIRLTNFLYKPGFYEPSQLDDALSLTNFLRSAKAKLDALGNMWNAETHDAYVIIQWVLRLYKDVLTYRIPARHTLANATKYLGSVYEIRECNNLIMRLDRIDDESLITESTIENTFGKTSMTSIKESFDSIGEDIKLCTTKKEMQKICHSVNMEMAKINNYLESVDVSKEDFDKLLDYDLKYREFRRSINKIF